MAEKFALSMTNNPHVMKLYYSFQSPEALYLTLTPSRTRTAIRSETAAHTLMHPRTPRHLPIPL